MKRQIDLGLLYSRSGSYVLISEACRLGVLTAIDEVNADPALDIRFTPVERDPGGNLDLYGPLCEELLQSSTARHVIGCVTSSSRKEVIPTLERARASLWYVVPYEGFEASDHVVYTHACPNQHLLPLLRWSFERFGKSAYLTGSNYIWGWEMNRLARERISEAGGEILGERYLPIGSTDVERMIAEIRATRPNFILNNLIGQTQYTFLRAYAALGQLDPHFTAQSCPVLSCNLTECELPAIGEAAEGLIAAGPYFRATQGQPTKGRFGSSHEASGYAAVWMLARLLNGRPGAEQLPISSLLTPEAAAQIRVDRHTHHTALPALIGQVRAGQFEVIADFGRVDADPWLTQARSEAGQPKLRVVP
ncbi:transporter substrate-binding protein [Xinfangfangia sp. CPCC 101601]|uniref:Transporter substrate-binding protein n=1 Tax=Pseudogemmobacter lacusdianii TaxID=3069608 RepID=A0ABU0VY73_9RHOB|nr:transporter substrate-binding protein [Xinfangfangia sp. CPCC 101601]MDQ2066578.1 transporter substrate-binding protein [Xinfangfangia sp. CPCC 101601]